jgi:hypothetical protein
MQHNCRIQYCTHVHHGYPTVTVVFHIMRYSGERIESVLNYDTAIQL